MCASVFARAKTDTRCPHWKDPRYLRGAYIMNHKKLLLTLTLCLCALLCMVVTASASEVQEHSHPICGATHTNIGDHTGPCGDVTWTAWDGNDMDAETRDIQLTTGHYYLSNNVTPTSTIHIVGQVCLCLNGCTLSYSGDVSSDSDSIGGMILLDDEAVLNICDCKGGGSIVYDHSSSTWRKSTILVKGKSTLNLYGGSVIKEKGTETTAVDLNYYAGANFYMYGGKVENRSTQNTYNTYAVYVGGKPGNQVKRSDVKLYEGEVGSRGYGIRVYDAKPSILVAGGKIESDNTAIAVGDASLTLQGKPIIKTTEDDSAAIKVGSNNIKVEDSFAPTSPVSVGDTSETFGTASSADKAQYFTSFESGKFVAYDNGTLKFTACAITQQPTKDNSYTVKGNAPDSKLSYRWYAAQEGEITVTDAVAKKSANASYWNASKKWQVKCGDKIDCFTLYMNKGEVLTLSDISRGWVSEISISGTEVTEDNGTYTFTAPAAGEYTLKISATGRNDYPGNYPGDPYLNFEAALRTLVPDTTKPMGGTTAVLATTGLSAGDYICQVTWEGKSALNSGVVQFSGSSQQPTGSGSYYYTPSAAEDKKDSPKTADPGVLLYAGLALASLTGLACTAKKRH